MLSASQTSKTTSTWRDPLYWLIVLLLVAYVGLLSRGVVYHGTTDFWEHHRAVVTLTQDMGQPGNPTFATDDPSIRYSPYSVFLASICRLTGISSWSVFSLAAAANTLLLLLAIRFLLAQFGLASASSAVILVMVTLYGESPGYANTLALCDLPWHQVNPSAFAMAAILFVLALLKWGEARTWRQMGWTVPAIAVTLSAAILTHAMTGALGAFELVLFALLAPTGRRGRQILVVCTIGLLCFLLCSLWPWYSFATALLQPSSAEWFNRTILTRSLFVWCFPAIVASLTAILLPYRPFVRHFALAAALAMILGVLSYASKSATMARFPLAGVFFCQALVGVFIHHTRMLRPNEWRAKLRSLLASETPQRASLVVQCMLLIVLARCIAPQFVNILREPHLARPYIASMVGLKPKQRDHREIFETLLAPVGQHDVVLADRTTAWPVPSIAGRIVAAQSYELFVRDQRERDADVRRFLEQTTDAETRCDILIRYNVRWIILSRREQSPVVFEALFDADAVRAEHADLVLMDAQIWRQRCKPK